MGYQNEKSLKEVLQQYMKEMGFQQKYIHSKIMAGYDNMMDSYILKKTDKIEFKNGKLTIFIHSPELRQELSMLKSSIIIKLNDYLGSEEIKEIEIL